MAWPDRLAQQLVTSGLAENMSVDVVAYGLQTGAEFLLNVVTTALIGALFGAVPASFLFLVSLLMVRSYAGGYHAKTAGVCYVQSCLLLVSALLVYRHCPAELVLPATLVLAALSAPIIWCLAPVAAPNKPLDAVEVAYYRTKSRFWLLVTVGLVMVLLFLRAKYALIVSFSLFLIAAFMILGRRKSHFS